MSIHVLQIPSPNGHDVVKFDPANEAQVANAMMVFNALVNEQKNVAAKKLADGGSTKIKEFDPAAETTLFIRPLQGG